MSSSYSSSHASSSSGSGGGGGGGGGAKKQQSLRSLKSSSNSSSRLLGMTASDAQGRLFRGTELSSSTATLPKKFRKQAVDTQVFNKFALAKRGSAGKGKGKGKAADNLLPYDKIVVPKLNRAGKVSLPELAPGELDNMWLVGFQVSRSVHARARVRPTKLSQTAVGCVCACLLEMPALHANVI